MGLQKFRADERGETCPNGARAFYTRWIGGPSLALIRNCPTPFGPRTVYVQGEPDTWFSMPAACEFRKRRILGYLTRRDEDGGWTFRACTQGPNTVYPNAETES